MDLAKAIKALGALRDKMTYEEVLEARKSVQEMENALGRTVLVYEKSGMGHDNLLQMIAIFEKIKEEILHHYEQ